MIPRILCRKCGNELGFRDKFCSKCGTEVEWGDGAAATSPDSRAHSVSQLRRCPLCGQENPADVQNCQSCGAMLEGSRQSVKNKPLRGRATQQTKNAPFAAFQGWQLIAGFGVILIAVVVVMKMQHGNEHASQILVAPANTQAGKEIEALEQEIETNPKNGDAILRLADLYHDGKQWNQAVEMYNRFLEIHPENPDARVDLGISYFEMSIGDTARRGEYSDSAIREMEQALAYAPRHQLAHFNLGIVNLHTGNIEKATEWFKKCVTIDPNSETGKKAQKLLNQHTLNNPS